MYVLLFETRTVGIEKINVPPQCTQQATPSTRQKNVVYEVTARFQDFERPAIQRGRKVIKPLRTHVAKTALPL